MSQLKKNELTHYGVLGMKWGTRRAAQSSAKGSKRKSRGTSSSKVKKETTASKVKSMSDEDLKKAVNRLQMEQQYTKLSKSNIAKGQQYAQTAFKAATTVATLTATALTIYNNVGKIKSIMEKAT